MTVNMHVPQTPAHQGAAFDPAALMGEALSIVKTYLQTATVAPSDLPSLITSVFEAISAPVASAPAAADGSVGHETSEETGVLGSDSSEASAEDEPAETYPFAHISREPAVPVEESVQDDGIVCLIDGTKKLMIKRHIRAISGMEWEDYLAHFGLPSNYPSVAPSYSKEKSVYAKKVGLGSLIDKTPRSQREGTDEKAETPARRVRRVKMAEIA